MSRLLPFLLLLGWFFQPLQAQESNQPLVKIDTNIGTFTLRLFQQESPITVANFLAYVDEGFYDGTIFHRVIKRFVVQGGGFTKDMQEKPNHEPIINESKNRLHNDRFTVAMARTDNPDSATSQFFINLRMNGRLNSSMGKAGYTVFGEVISGQDVVNEMGFVATHTFAGMDDVPVEPIYIIKAERID